MKMKIKNKNFELSRDSMLKMISILFAIFLFLYVRGEVDPETTITYKEIPIRYENLAELKSNDLALITKEGETVDVSIVVKQSSISKISREDIDASVNLAGYYTGDFKLPINIKISGEAKVEKRNPDKLAVRIEENIVQEIPVDIQTTGILPDGYIIGDLKTKEKVKVKGPTSAIDTIDKIIALYDVSERKESSVMVSTPVAYDKNGDEIKTVSIEPKQLQIEVPILKSISVPVKLNLVGDVDPNIDTSKFVVAPNVITIKGNAELIDKITDVKTEPITAEKILSGEKAIKVSMPNGISQVDKDVLFVVSNGPIEVKKQEFTFSTDDIKLLDLDEKISISYVNVENINIIISPKNPLSKETLNKEDIKLTVNLENLNEGNNTVKLNVSVPENFRVIENSKPNLDIKLSKRGIFN